MANKNGIAQNPQNQKGSQSGNQGNQNPKGQGQANQGQRPAPQAPNPQSKKNFQPTKDIEEQACSGSSFNSSPF